MHDDIDLTDLDRFAVGFPHHVFDELRQLSPVWFHPPTVHTPGGEGSTMNLPVMTRLMR